MMKVLHLPSPRAGTLVRIIAPSPAPAMAPTASVLERFSEPVERQAAIENALTMALYFVRQPGDGASNLWAATARTNRALTLLKQASQGNPHAGTTTPLGRA